MKRNTGKAAVSCSKQNLKKHERIRFSRQERRWARILGKDIPDISKEDE